MDATPSIATIGALLSSQARSKMLAELFDGRALTATELSIVAGVSAATSSEHLGKLIDAGIITCEQHGRHRYFKLAGSHIAEAIEPLFNLAQRRSDARGLIAAKSRGLEAARLCYDHLAGRLGVAITSGMINKRYLVPDSQNYVLTSKGEAFLTEWGIDVDKAKTKRRLFARQCLDWSERKPHLSGALGVAITEHAFVSKWIKRTNRRREIKLTEKGRIILIDCLAISL